MSKTFSIIKDVDRQWRELQAITDKHGLCLSDVIWALTCYIEQNEDEYDANIVDDLGYLTWQIPHSDETPEQALKSAMYYVGEFGPQLLYRSKIAIRIIESL